MKRLTRNLLSLALCLTVALSMCASFTGTADAATQQTVYNGSTISVSDINTVDVDTLGYQTGTISNTNTIKVNLKLPSNGGTLFTLVPEDYAYVRVSGTTSTDSMKVTSYADTFTRRSFYVSGNTATLELTPYSSAKGGRINFGVLFAPTSRTITANGTEYVLGATGNTSVSSFTVNTSGKGYLEVTAYGGFTSPYSAQINTSGFKGWESLYSSEGYTTRIGVKKGTYKISMKSNYTAVRNVKVTFHKVKETSSKTSKKKAAKIKKKKANKGVVVTNAKKVHWYKIKNTKNQKMKLYYNAANVGEGSSSSSKLKVTVYFPDKKKKVGYIYPGNKGYFTVTYGTIGTSKARKGTYYVKVQSVGGANGYYTLTWK